MASLRDRLRELGRELATREAEHKGALDEARRKAASLRAEVAEALEGWREAVTAAGAPSSPSRSARSGPTTSTCAPSSSTSRAGGTARSSR